MGIGTGSLGLLVVEFWNFAFGASRIPVLTYSSALIISVALQEDPIENLFSGHQSSYIGVSIGGLCGAQQPLVVEVLFWATHYKLPTWGGCGVTPSLVRRFPLVRGRSLELVGFRGTLV